MAGRFSIEATFRAIDKMTAPLNRMSGSTKKFSKSIRQDFAKAQRSVERLGRSIKNKLGRALRTGLLVGVAALGIGLGIATQEFIEFDKSIVNATAKFKDITPGTDQANRAMEALRKTARMVGAETQFSASEAAKGLEFLGMAGFTSAQSMKLLPGIVDLATVANVDLARATDIASDALGAFGLMSDDTGQLNKNLTRVMDVMAKTVTSTNTDMEMLFETMKFAGPAFTSAGQSLETFSAIAGRMAANGIKASMAGTAMRSMVLRLQRPTKEVSKGFAMFGVTMKDFVKDGKLIDMIDIMAILEKRGKKLTTVQRNSALSAITGKHAFSGWAAVMNEGAEKSRLLKESLERATGASKKMAEFMRGSFSVRLQILKSSLIELGFKFIEAFEKRGGQALKSITKAVQNFDVAPFVDGMKMAISVIGTFISIVKPLLPFILGLIIAFKGYRLAMLASAAAQKIFDLATKASPLGIILTVIGLVIGAVISLKNNWNILTLNWKIGTNTISRNIASLEVKLLNLLSKIPGIGDKFKDSLSRARSEFSQLEKEGKLLKDIDLKVKTGNLNEKQIGALLKTIPSSDEKEAERRGTISAFGGPITQSESFSRSLSEKKTTNRVVIENQSGGDVSKNGDRFGNGQSIMLPESG